MGLQVLDFPVCQQGTAHAFAIQGPAFQVFIQKNMLAHGDITKVCVDIDIPYQRQRLDFGGNKPGFDQALIQAAVEQIGAQVLCGKAFADR